MELAKAYVQVVPSAQGIKGSLTGVMGSEATSAGNSAGSLLGSGLAKKLIGVVAAAQIGQKIVSGISDSINAGGALEQSLGGIETLFKDSADIVIKNAQNAFQTSGLSANDYMESVTSFSASLLQGLAGDTETAALVADMALTDMSDNANKMGTSMESIQNAYQGFAKQNYTMLDNLKLGYGGTKEEMQRLLKDAQEISGVKYDISNLSDVYNAIHVIQGELGITGTTAQEAATTLAGSSAAMKGAWENLMAYMSSGEGDVTQAVTDLMTTTSTYLFDNLLPMIGNILASLPDAISTAYESLAPKLKEGGTKLIEFLQYGFSEGLPNLFSNASTMLSGLLTKITEGLPGVLEKGKEIITNIITGYTQGQPSLITSVGDMLTSIIDFIATGLPMILDTGIDILISLVDGIITAMPNIVTAMSTVMTKLLTTIANNLPSLLQKGIELIAKLVAGLLQAIPKVIEAVPKIAKAISETLMKIDWLTIGKNIIQGIANGLVSAGSILIEAAKNAGKAALKAIKEALGIHSPSKVFEDEVGKMIDLGIAEGIENNTNAVRNSMRALSKETVGNAQISFGTSADIDSKYNANSSMIDYTRLGNAVANALVQSGLSVKINNRELGRVVGGYL